VVHQVRCVAFDFGGTLASPGPEPGGDLVAEVLATVAGREVPPPGRGWGPVGPVRSCPPVDDVGTD
jgi:hypothetical protein